MKQKLNVAFIGNPNCGKTTLFNAYTGAKLKVANWPGVTVEKKEGSFKYQNERFKLVDLPGIYSLTSYTMEEKLSRQYILEDEVDVIVDVADASSLERNLYLALQLIELGKPVVLALNMMDIVEERGMEIDTNMLSHMLGISSIPVSARKKTGLDKLMDAVANHRDQKHMDNESKEYVVEYTEDIEHKINKIANRLIEKYPDIINPRWHAIKFVEMDEEIIGKYEIHFKDIVDRSYETDIINQKYDFIEKVIDKCLINKSEKAQVTDKVDQVLTHRILGLPIFLGIMALVFFLTFTVGDSIKGLFETGLDWFSGGALSLLQGMHVNATLTSLIVDGIIAGVGGILTFLPNIFILFLALAFLEDSGYMARVAYVMDSLMGKIGLSGRAFIPMLLGFGCSVPAIMASRTLEDPKDRLKTILITPFMSCSARLPIYVLFSQMFFAKHAMLVAYSMYLIGLVVAITVALIMNLISKQKDIHNLLIELPEYKAPNMRTISIYVWDKVKDYLARAGTVIFVASIIMWLILNLGPNGMVSDMSQSFGASIGKGLEPIFSPVGLGHWQIVLALIAGIAAKEVVVSSVSVLYGVGNISSAVGMKTMAGMLGAVGFTALNAYSLMVFCLLYVPCAAAIATVKKETNSWKWTVFAVLFQLAVAYIVSMLIYQIGSLF